MVMTIYPVLDQHDERNARHRERKREREAIGRRRERWREEAYIYRSFVWPHEHPKQQQETGKERKKE